MSDPSHRTRVSQQFTIRTVLVVTSFLAMWLGIYQVVSVGAWLLLPPVLTALVAYVLRRPNVLFLLPLVWNLGWIGIDFVPGWVSPPYPIMECITAAISLVVHVIFVIRWTTAAFRKRESRDGVIAVATGFSGLAGFLIGSMVAVPWAIFMGIQYLRGWIFYPEQIATLPGLVLGGALAGFVLGLLLGFVCDVIVGIEFGRRPRRIGQKKERHDVTF